MRGYNIPRCIAGWCNGSTSDSESLSPGSNPGPAAPSRPHSMGLLLFGTFAEPSWTCLDLQRVMVAVMVKTMVEFAEDVSKGGGPHLTSVGATNAVLDQKMLSP